MKCLHCGWCCFMYDVIIIAPEYATPNFKMKQINDDNMDKIAVHKATGKVCPHIKQQIKNGETLYFCKIHSLKWYKDTPCYRHGQIEETVNSNCRMGEYILKNPKMKLHMIKIFKGEL